MDIASLVYDVSKDLYAFYVKAKERDNDLNRFRAQILSMHEKSSLVKEVLQRPGVQAENKSKAEDALRNGKLAADELESTVAKLKAAGRQNQDTLAKLKARFTSFCLKTAWPLKKETIEALSGHLATCHNALGDAISILHLEVGVSHVEWLERLDKDITDGKISMESALENIRRATEKALQDVLQQLAQQKQMLIDEKNRREAEKIIAGLQYDQIENRERQIDDQAHNATYAWLFTPEGQETQEVKDLVQFLNTGTGLFWISGDAASGKSTLMKYLASPRHDGHDLWTWEGSQDVTIACHFCWIANDFQKTQSALLRTLLYHILQAELEIASEVRNTVWGTGPIREPWSVAQLWDSLNAAVKITRKRICIFIDGLDELQPETDHRELVENLKSLSRYDDLKLIVSSRPWPAFEALDMKRNTLRMSEVNNKAIIDYLQETMGHLEKLSGVCWTCLRKCEYWWNDSRHQGVESQRLVQDLLRKIDGNFLLASFMVSSVCSHLESGLSLASVRQVIDKKSKKLEVYLRDMIYERIDSNLISEAAMAIKIALIPFTVRSWEFFWILLASLNGEIPSMLNGQYVFKMPCLSYDQHASQAMLSNTKTFLSRCCRDILIVQRYGQVDFKHRSIFEFLHTPKNQQLLDEHTPDAFRDNFFGFRLAIARVKLCCRRRGVSGNAMKRAISINLQILMVELSPAHGGIALMRQKSDETTLLLLAREAEQVVIDHMQKYGELWIDAEIRSDRKDRQSLRVLRILCILLARFDLYQLTETVMARWPHYGVPYNSESRINLFFYALGVAESNLEINIDLLRRLLNAGVDPNMAYNDIPGKTQWSTTWCVFLQSLEKNQNAPTRIDEHEWEPSIYGAFAPQSFDSPTAQTAIKMLLEAGAELKLSEYEPFDGKYIDARVDPSATLKRWLTKEQLSKLGVPFAEQ